MGMEEKLKARISDLEGKLRQREEEILQVKEMSEEIQRLKSELHEVEILLHLEGELRQKEEEIKRLKAELHEVEILLHTKDEQMRRYNRRTKLSWYQPIPHEKRAMRGNQ
ncbi:MAG: hypothetical protein ACREQA_00520 [Candidatus Binatia bacterium]